MAYVRKIEDVKQDSIRVQRMMDEGYDIVESALPVLLTVVKELNQPRLPSLKGKMAAKKAEIKKLGIKDLEIDEKDTGLKGSPTQVRNIFAPEARTGRRMLHGNVEEQVNQLVEELKKLRCL